MVDWFLVRRGRKNSCSSTTPIGNGRESRHDNVIPTSLGTSRDYLLRRIARDCPELLDDIGKNKRFKSARAAAIEAGIFVSQTNCQAELARTFGEGYRAAARTGGRATAPEVSQLPPTLALAWLANTLPSFQGSYGP